MRFLRDVQAILTALCGVTLLLSFFPIADWMPYASVAFGAYFALGAAWESLKLRQLDVNFLMVFAAAGAVAVGHPEDAAALLFLFSLSSTLEAFAMARTKSAIEGLIKLRPDTATRVTEERDERVPIEALEIGDHIRIAPYENVPADGVVVQGASSLNQSAMTGESVPAEKTIGDHVLAGTQNLQGMLLVSVTARAGQTTLEKIVELVRDAQENKASGERISTWFGQRYTFLVLGAFGVSFVLRWLLGAAPSSAFFTSLILLVAMSPCAVVISTPASTLSALAWAARNGLLIRGGEYIEALGKVDTIAMDKTGTLTSGQPKLVEICVCSHAFQPVGGGDTIQKEEDACWQGHGALSEDAAAMLRAAAAAEQYSSHPIAAAIVAAGREHGLQVPEALEQQDVSGLGVVARLPEGTVKVGQRRFFEAEGSGLPSEFAEHVEEMQHRGMTVAILEFQGRLCGLGLRDEPRQEAMQTLQELRELGIDQLLMLTGDTKQTAQAVAAELGIEEIHAGLLPDAKTAIVESLVSSGRRVAVVGDGINDAPSLAKANVGIAMGGLGSDVALNAADVVIMQDRLDRLPLLVRLGRRTNSVIKANLWIGTGMIVALTIASLAAVLPLPLAVIGHEGSTVVVILNGLRLLRGPRP